MVSFSTRRASTSRAERSGQVGEVLRAAGAAVLVGAVLHGGGAVGGQAADVAPRQPALCARHVPRRLQQLLLQHALLLLRCLPAARDTDEFL